MVDTGHPTGGMPSKTGRCLLLWEREIGVLYATCDRHLVVDFSAAFWGERHCKGVRNLPQYPGVGAGHRADGNRMRITPDVTRRRTATGHRSRTP